MKRLEDYAILRSSMPGVKLVQVIHVTGEEALEEVRSVAAFVDGLLLDSGTPKDPNNKQLGGTGRVHNWHISKRIVEEAHHLPVFLAGGLNSNNVVEAINTVMPYGVDICSGIRTNDCLDENKLQTFFQEMHHLNSLFVPFTDSPS